MRRTSVVSNLIQHIQHSLNESDEATASVARTIISYASPFPIIDTEPCTVNDTISSVINNATSSAAVTDTRYESDDVPTDVQSLALPSSQLLRFLFIL